MLVINDRLEKWEISSYEKDRLKAGNHRVFTATEKSFLCPHCRKVQTFYLGTAIAFCMECKREIPQADSMITSLDYRVAYHLSKEGGIFVC